jgi:sulfoxide reductase heme-binding subunit YedZ
LWQGVSGGLGPDPVKAIERQLGEWALWALIAGLAVSPLRRFLGVNLVKYRRAAGLVAFAYVILHFLTWVVLDMGLRLDEAVKDIAKRPYVTAGMVALAVMIPLAATSNAWSIRRLGAVNWNKLHRLTYVAAGAAALHYLWLAKVWQLDVILYVAAILGLLALRLIPRRSHAAPAPYLREAA